MFSLFEAHSLQPVRKRRQDHSGFSKLSLQDSRKKGFNQKRIEQHSFVGTRSKSRYGCDGCRLRRKRCDEVHPICGACLKRNDTCAWSYHLRTKEKPTTIEKVLDPKLERHEIEYQESDCKLVEIESQDDFVEENAKAETHHALVPYMPINDGDNDNDIECVQRVTALEDAMDDMFKSNTLSPRLVFTSAPLKYLDSNGCLFWDFYRYKGSAIGCVGIDDSNYFFKCYVKVCEGNEAICNLLAAWGGIYLKDNPEDEVVHSYIRRGYSLLPPTDAQTLIKCNAKRFWAMCFYSVLYTFYVTTGDPNHWWPVFLKLKEIIDLSGGLIKICEDYNYSNDIIFIISLMQYFSCTSSELWINGPIYPLSEFQQVFAKVDFGNFGVDPVQGAFYTIYWRLAEVATNKILLEKQKSYVEDLYRKASASLFTNETLNGLYKSAKLDYVECSLLVFDSMMLKINMEKPSISQLLLISDDTEHQLQIDIFETYKKVCKLCCYFHLKRASPLVHEVQVLLEETLHLVEGLRDSKMRVSMIIPLLTCSMAAVTDYDKRRIENCFKHLRDGCAVYNVDLAWFLAQEIWLRNPEGNKIVDWAQICKEKNWHINAC